MSVYRTVADAVAQREEDDRHRVLSGLAEQSPYFVQLQEVLGRPPQIDEVGSWFVTNCAVIAADPEEAWGRYASIVERVRKAELVEASD
jgi:hypothetical protein